MKGKSTSKIIPRNIEIKTQSALQTTRLSNQIGKYLIAQKKGIVIGLKGELGGGKTTFTQGLAKGMKIDSRILSPTFVIMKNFQLDRKRRFYHFDVYRISGSSEMKCLGFKEIVKDVNNIIVVEWANLIKDLMPKNTIWIDFQVESKESRIINFIFPDQACYKIFEPILLKYR